MAIHQATQRVGVKSTEESPCVCTCPRKTVLSSSALANLSNDGLSKCVACDKKVKLETSRPGKENIPPLHSNMGQLHNGTPQKSVASKIDEPFTPMANLK